MKSDLDLEDALIIQILEAEIDKQANLEPTVNPQRMRTGLSGHEYVVELLACGHSRRIHSVLRMELATFNQLKEKLILNTDLSGADICDNVKRGGVGGYMPVSVDEKLVIFLHITTLAASLESTAERFSHSKSMISNIFHEVLDALLLLYVKFVKLPNTTTPQSDRISDNPKYTPYFDDCLGALDGTHIGAHVLQKDQVRYRNRKGELSQNVLAVCNFDLEFTYILAGWEGSAHDGKVLADALAGKDFRQIKEKYWLGDAGYRNSEFIMAPYRGVRYHLREQRQSNQRPANSKELFNLQHASLCNVIERIFGVLKRKFKILAHKPEFSIDTQTDLILDLCALWNFIRSRENASIQQEMDEFELVDEIVVNQEETEGSSYTSQGAGRKLIDEKRSCIAKAIWIDYEKYLVMEIE